MELPIHIIPLNEINQNILSFLKRRLEEIFRTEIKTLNPLTISQTFYDPQRNQYNANEILNFLIKEFDLISSPHIFLGIFDKDIYTPSLNFVFGLATKTPKACLISISRLDPSFYECRETEEDHQTLYFQRILTEAVHEIGHTLGLDHCPNPKCVMHFSNTLSDTDIKGHEFCENCGESIQG